MGKGKDKKVEEQSEDEEPLKQTKGKRKSKGAGNTKGAAKKQRPSSANKKGGKKGQEGADSEFTVGSSEEADSDAETSEYQTLKDRKRTKGYVNERDIDSDNYDEESYNSEDNEVNKYLFIRHGRKFSLYL